MDIPTLEYISKELENKQKELEKSDFMTVSKLAKINQIIEIKIKINELIFKELTK
jgi:hypothetical protein